MLTSAGAGFAHPNKSDGWTGNANHGWSDWDPADGPSDQAATVGQLVDSYRAFVLGADGVGDTLERAVSGGVALQRYLRSVQHDAEGGHLPASSKNVELVGKIQLTDVDGGIADVGYHKGYAYLNAFSSECAGRAGAQGTGVHVVDVRDPANPQKVAFLPSEANSYQGEGVHVITFNGRDILVNNNETCDATQAVVSGFSIWDVTNPTSPSKLGQFGDTTPAVPLQTYHTTHSVQAFVWNGKAYAVAQDNQDLEDVDIFDITPTLDGGGAVLVSEVGLEDWPGAQGSYANGDTVFHHDMQQKVIGGHNFLLVSYWDAGQVLLNIDDPANPQFVTDSDFSNPDPEQPAFEVPEGQSHQSYFDQDGEYVISTDEDFSPTRTLCRFDSSTGPETDCGEFGWTPQLAGLYPDGFTGPTRFGGTGCDAGTVPPATGDGQALVVSRGGCFFSIKTENAQNAGYDLAVVGQSHAGSRNGLLPDSFFCGGQGHDYDEQIPAVCIGHAAMHQLFGTTPQYASADGADIPVGAEGGALFAKGGVFDGWGYVHLHRNAPNLPEIDTYAVPESQDPSFQQGFGNLTVHEVKTDPRDGKDIAYFSYYAAGLRVAKFGAGGIQEVGHYIAEGGNDFWGVVPALPGNVAGSKGKARNLARPLILMSDRDSGLWIFRYTGKE